MEGLVNYKVRDLTVGLKISLTVLLIFILVGAIYLYLEINSG